MVISTTPDQIDKIHKSIVPKHYSNRIPAIIMTLITLVLAHQQWITIDPLHLSQRIKPKHVAMVQLVWCGLVFGVSLLEAWVKFRAQYCVRYIGLDMGRTVFFALNRAEVFLACLWYLFTVICSSEMTVVTLLDVIPVLFLVMQVMVMQPILDRSGIHVIQETVHGRKTHAKGNAPLTHIVYVLLEFVKVFVLLAAVNHKL